ncbi:MAG: twin-arginine translocase subunit TatC [Endomicrobiales bacterium]
MEKRNSDPDSLTVIGHPDELRAGIIRGLLFLLGNAFAFQALVPAALRFLIALSRGMALVTFTLGGYVSFVLALMDVSGIVFEMPFAAALLTRARLLTPALMRGEQPGLSPYVLQFFHVPFPARPCRRAQEVLVPVPLPAFRS